MRVRKFLCWMAILWASVLMAACSPYERQVAPFKLPAAYPNTVEVAGVQLAAKSYDDPKDAQTAFGFDIRGAKILPVQVIFDNKGTQSIEIVPEQTFLVDSESNLWPIIDAGLVYDRVAKKTELSGVAPDAGKAGLLAGTAGAIIGAAVGIVSGHNVGDATMKGAAVGAATGLVSGGAKGLLDSDVQDKICKDLKNSSLERRAVKPHEIAHGFIFFPGESQKAKELRLQVRMVETGRVYSLTLNL